MNDNEVRSLEGAGVPVSDLLRQLKGYTPKSLPYLVWSEERLSVEVLRKMPIAWQSSYWPDFSVSIQVFAVDSGKLRELPVRCFNLAPTAWPLEASPDANLEMRRMEEDRIREQVSLSRDPKDSLHSLLEAVERIHGLWTEELFQRHRIPSLDNYLSGNEDMLITGQVICWTFRGGSLESWYLIQYHWPQEDPCRTSIRAVHQEKQALVALSPN